ncbi:hypothetical protein H5A40_14740 [Pectobacterium brasiliense]|uniref:hypothetical protein n=1 Tax=Pectobacterium brasiliense TaxID=180957 RepID=UPI0019693A7A|nr:hypothetical protein [Pectobacterium brasiliense]QSD34330.1 hypothetical protein H5A40_14740 [Pectobacterium brasiliense]
MKCIIYLVIMTSMLWSWYAFPDYSPLAILSFSAIDMTGIMRNTLYTLVGLYKYTLPSVFWVVFIVYIYDFIASILNRNTPYMRALYNSCKIELSILLFISLFTFLLFWRTQSTFTEYSVDIGMAGLSFMLSGNFSLLKLFKFKVGSINYPYKIAFIISLVMAMISCYNAKIIYEIAMGEYNKIQSIWLQITVFTYSISLYFASKHVAFVIDTKKLGASPVMLSLFKSLHIKYNLYQDLVNGIDLWNRETKKEITKASANLRKKKKKK